MAINRRDLLKNFALLTATSFLPMTVSANTKKNSERVIGACRLAQNQYGVTCIDATGNQQWQFDIPARGHDVALSSTLGIGVVIARRPDQFIVLFNLSSGEKLQTLIVDDSLKLNGHAVWYHNQLIVTASDRESSQMRLLSYDLIDQSNQLEPAKSTPFPYFGPHELVMFQDTMWVAVGGLKTDEREVTNKTGFESFLIQLKPSTLAVMNEYPAPNSGVSLRHMTVNSKGIPFIAGQYQLDTTNSPCLLYKLEDQNLIPFQGDNQLWPRIKGYIGSIASIDNQIIVTSPRSHWMGIFSEQSLTLQGQMLSHDICALTPTSSGYIAGTGTGRIYINGNMVNSHVIWDNHFSSAFVAS